MWISLDHGELRRRHAALAETYGPMRVRPRRRIQGGSQSGPSRSGGVARYRAVDRLKFKEGLGPKAMSSGKTLAHPVHAIADVSKAISCRSFRSVVNAMRCSLDRSRGKLCRELSGKLQKVRPASMRTSLSTTIRSGLQPNEVRFSLQTPKRARGRQRKDPPIQTIAGPLLGV